MSLRLAVFASGGGSNLQALIDRFNNKEYDAGARVVLVITDRPNAGALERARQAKVDAVVTPVKDRPVDLVARELLASLDGADIDLIALAGYVQLIPSAVVRNYRDRIVNIHPALLPSFGGKGMYGMHVHRAVIAAGTTVSGATVHMVNDRYDEGRIIAQWPVPVLHDDTPERLAARVLQVEHVLYPAAIEALAHTRDRHEPPTRFGPGVFASFNYSDASAPSLADVRRSLGLD